MNDARIAALAAWIVEQGVAGGQFASLLAEACQRAIDAGLPLARVAVLFDTLHPTFEGRVINWTAATGEVTGLDYGRSDTGDAADRWLQSPLHRLYESGDSELRRRVDAAAAVEFPVIADLLEAGMTDYVAMLHRFAPDRIIGALDGVYLTWATAAPGGFDDGHMAALRRLAPPLALAVKAAALARIAGTLVETYLGRDAGRRVLSGGINRGVAERIEAVVWFSDLHGYTRISDTAEPDHIIPLLNDYAGAVIPAIHAAGGDVLKLIGDGILAIFTGGDRGEACRAALAAVAAARGAVGAVNVTRSAAGLAVTDLYLALHLGEVFYGNIGSADRLDFTVVGPAVNEAARIAALCPSVDQPVLVSSAFAAAVKDPRLVSVGRFALRGVGRAQDLFTLDPGAR